MAASFRGLYLCPPRGERPSHVRVRDAEQGETTLPLDTYEAHGGQPPWQSLPWGEESGAAGADADTGAVEASGRGPEISM